MIAGFVAWLRAPSRRAPWWIVFLLGLELQSGLLLGAWGSFSLMWVDFDFQPAYTVAVEGISGPAWATLALLVGASQVGCGALDARRARWCFAFLACVLWSALALLLFRGPVTPPGLVLNAGLALGNLPSLVLLRPRWR